MNLDVHTSPHIWEVLSHYFLNKLSTPFSLSSSVTPVVCGLFLLMCPVSPIGFLHSSSFWLCFVSFWLDNFKWSLFRLTDSFFCLVFLWRTLHQYKCHSFPIFRKIPGGPGCLMKSIRPSPSLIKTEKQVKECLSRKQYTPWPTKSNQEHKDFLVVQWLRLQASNAGGMGSVPGMGNSACLWCGHEKKKSKLTK